MPAATKSLTKSHVKSRAKPRTAVWLKAEEQKSLLRLITCGSVDDGKSTLIGRLLYESQLLMEDQLAELKRDSARRGAGALDFSLLVDGLAAEREQGITIDVAYRFFATKRRKFIIADAPGHEDYTRNMVTGASHADVAILLLDARKGVLVQTRRHAFLASLLGIRHVILAFNKMDLVGYARAPFAAAVEEFRRFAKPLGFATIAPIPISALKGDNVVRRAATMPWYKGPTLLAQLERAPLPTPAEDAPFVMPVQWVNRPHADFRGFAGRIASGAVRTGDAVVVVPHARPARVKRILTPRGEAREALSGQSVTLVLDRELDISRGDVLCAADAPLETSDQLEATIVWMARAPMLPGRRMRLKLASATVPASIMEQKYQINVNTMEHMASKALQLNEIGHCTITLDRPIPFAPYRDHPALGGFILIDRMNHATLGAGMIRFGLERAQNVRWQKLTLTQSAHEAQKGQKAAVLWFTGLSGSGKSTIANELQKLIYAAGGHSTILDGDNVRHGLNRDLGFKDEDRVENIRRVSEVAKLMVEAGLIVMVSFISPFRSDRRSARRLIGSDAFLEIFVDTQLEEAERRDPKGLYKKARRGLIRNFTGISSPYEPPRRAEIRIDTHAQSAKLAAKSILAELRARGILDAAPDGKP